MCDSDVLDLLFDQGAGILDSQVVNKKEPEMADFDFNSLPADLMIADLNSGIKDTNKLDLDLDFNNWGYLKQGTDEDMLFNSLLNSNLPDDEKQSQHMKHIDHAYSTAPAASPKSDSGISADPSSPLSFNSSADDLAPLSLEEELFGPLDLKHYDDMDTSMMADQVFPDSNSEEGDMSPRLQGNESPVSFDFEPVQKKSGKIIINTTPAGNTKLIKVLSVNQKPNKPLQSLLGQKPAQHSQTTNKSGLQELVLSDEEKELLRREGVTLPSHLPLTREEEKVLRSIRRRIRNKASARNSRKKKQDYMEALEERVKRCTDEKLKLEKKVNQLEKQNSSLMGQLRRLQKLVTEGTRHTARTGTCAMILALSFALVLLPNYQQFLSNNTDSEIDSAKPVTGRSSRTLLQTNDLNTPPTDCIQNTNSFLDFLPFLNKEKSVNFDSPCLVDEDVDDYHSDYKTIGMKRSFSSINEDYDLSSTVQDDVIHMEITKLPDDCKEGVCTPSPPSKKAKISV